MKAGSAPGGWAPAYLIAALYWMAPEIGPAVLLVGAAFGVLWIPFGVAAQQLLRPPLSWPRALAALVVVPSCWLLTEWLRSWQALGGPWAVFGVSQWQHPAMLALASVGGVWLISFALVLANVAIVLALASLPRVGAAVLPGALPRSGLAALGVAAAVASIGAGPLAFALTPPSPAVRQVTIAMVQPGVINDAILRADASEALTGQLSQGGTLGGVRPDLIVWGESRRATSSPRGPAAFASWPPTTLFWAVSTGDRTANLCFGGQDDGQCSCASITASAWCGQQPRGSVGNWIRVSSQVKSPAAKR